jgi:crotonobetainyl-CoA:carnitine CoA-transferase CaiB-like acyl-CoA transferase
VTNDPQADAAGFAPLAGIRVLDLTSSLAGPSATQLLAALGADVVKVEHPQRGDEAREWGPPFAEAGSALFYAANAGKRSLGLDVKSPAGLEVALRLADRADVYVQSMRPGTAERLGLGPDALRARNPRLVTCSIGAYGTTGPLKDLPGYDPLMQAAAGIVSLTGEADRPGVRVGTSLVDLGTGLWAALGIVAALHERERTGRGRAVDVSLYETALGLVPYQLIAALDAGARPTRHGTAFALIAPYQVFATADGELMVAAANDGLYRRLCETLGVPGLADDPRYATNPLRIEHRDGLIEALAARFRTFETDDLLGRLHAAGVPAAPVRELGEVAVDEQTRALGILQQLGERHTVAPPLSLDGERVRHASPPPLRGEHSRAILREAGYAGAEIAALVDAGVVSG